MDKLCLFCKKNIAVNKFCSLKCFQKNRSVGKYVYKSCEECGKVRRLLLRYIKHYGWGKFCSKKCQYLGSVGEKSSCWKGDNITYTALHSWVYRRRGKPNKCEFNHEHRGRFDWANKSGLYERVLDDWIMLCRSCHLRYDYSDLRRKKMSHNAKNAERDKLGRFVGNIN